MQASQSFLSALNACAALSFGASTEVFARAYGQAYLAACTQDNQLTEAAFRESFFRSASRLFGGEASSRVEQSIAQSAVAHGRRALAASFATSSRLF